MVGFLKKLTQKGEDFYLEIKDGDEAPSEPLTPKAKAPEPDEPAVVAKPVTMAAPAPAPVVVPPPPLPVAPKPESQPDVTFAPEYGGTLQTFGKRKPGPSLNPFMTMAQQMRR
ncbi:hypothetical protein VB712_02020 [Spirulina sp. CCNP1310]|uniref:hypothetical protein n=1 Tax=Spirulina sp. CCNP1310 TaxID=3110249 RepID=UPI002B1F8AC8|nr:hypothetical protein [Spirulina sp. CCNP1310]MEA5417981.1 hypothetical protein [Spirulina sp. CCNP1310]